MAIRYCEVETCGEELSEGTGTQGGLPICQRCRSAQYYWRRKGPKALAARKTALELYTHRVEFLAPYIGKMLKAASDRVSAARSRAKDVQTSTRH